MWCEVLRRKQTGFLFLRQKPIFRFIVDFYCSELNLAIEIDGKSHKKRKGYDEERDKFLKQIGINTIRFSSDEVMDNIENVKNILKISLVKGRNPDENRGEGLKNYTLTKP
jgi:very-short-patch-repair endonuclease